MKRRVIAGTHTVSRAPRRTHRGQIAIILTFAFLAVTVAGAPEGGIASADFRVLSGHTGAVLSVAFSPDGRLLASGGGDGTVRIWSVATGRAERILNTSGRSVIGVTFTPDGATLVGDSLGNATQLWSTRTWTVAHVLKRRTADAGSIAISPDGTLLARIGGYLGRAIELWDLRRRRVIRTLVGTEWRVTALAFSPDGRLIASAGDQTLRIWEVPSGTQRRVIARKGGVRSVVWSPDGRTLATASGVFDPSSGESDLKITIWDPVAGTVQRQLGSFPENGDFIQVVAYSPDGQFIAGGSWRSDKVGIFRVQTGEEIRAYGAHTGNITSLAFSPDSTLLASASEDATIRLWRFRP